MENEYEFKLGSIQSVISDGITLIMDNKNNNPNNMAKFGETKKSRDFAYFYHISLYKIDPRAEFHEIRSLDPILPGNAFNI